VSLESQVGLQVISGLAPRRLRSRRGEGERLREEILDVAEQLLFETADAEAVSIRAIGQRVGVTAPSIYRHFPDKETLIREVCRRGFDRLDEVMVLRSSQVEDPLEKIHAMAIGYADFALGNPGQYRVLLMSPNIEHHHESPATLTESPATLTESPATHTPPSIQAVLDQRGDSHTEMAGIQMLCDAVTEAMDRGRLRRNDPLELALLLWAAVHGIVSLRLADPAMPWPPVETQLQSLFRVLAFGMCESPGA
jgi:AcrR family transcriptional regulator